MVDGMMSATLSFKNLIDPMVRNDAKNADGIAKLANGGGQALNFYSQARKEGWMMAGRYYWDLLRVEDSYDILMSKSASYANYIPDSNSYVAPGSSGAMGALPSSDNLAKTSTLITATLNSGGYIDLALDSISNYTGAAKSGQALASMPGFLSSFGAFKVLLAFLPFAAVISDVTELIITFSSAGPVGLGAEPILWLHKLGLTCISLGV